ncbi:Eco57I restriction-modification methylase domain-containing protein [Rhodovulum sp. YNF3179]|uniref:Eco57I restriction-modification methylase domain-containing protein n=1 Tax=Rhodovulum sp. YNF3179 TaxID=3425127 RepID=UPI003D3473FF
MKPTSVHSEWLSLIDVSGPFLAEPVLNEAFPQGLEGLESDVRRSLRQAYDEWRDAIDNEDPDAEAYHAAWIDLVLRTGLDFDDDVLKTSDALPENLRFEVPEHGLTLRPDMAVVDDQHADKPLLLVVTYDSRVDLDDPVAVDRWATSPAERMVDLCRGTGVRLGLLTNGEHWMLVDAAVGGVPSFASWYARLWGQEPKTLQSFVNLLGIRRFFLDREEQLPALLDRSLKMQDEVTDALGEQVRRAVEVLIQALDREDANRNRELLDGIEPSELYEAGLTVMMRIVFLLSAEERGLLLMGDEGYEANYAVSTLRTQLRENTEEILERRWDAWSRLLAIFRAVYAGIEHESLRMPALGGSLFDPDRFPFLEGRKRGSNWRNDQAAPLPIDNRTVLLLLEAVQLFQGRTLSYRALDVEQIGYVYEGLLERTAIKAKEITLDLDATKKSKKPWVTLEELETAATSGREALAALLQERTGSSASRVSNDLAKPVDDADGNKLLTACHADVALKDRIRPYFHLLRSDPWGYPLVYPKNTFMVTTGADRRETGTHYTPKSLTEAIVKETLEPVVYVGPAEGAPRADWRLKSPAELLDLKICDPAMGSGAFLVQVCRWLGERLVEAWDAAEAERKAVTQNGRVVDTLGSEEPLAKDDDERLLTAKRLIAERCLYGVDLNPLAVELAKLSIWLVTLAKGRPFGFLDHNLKSGDSLLGITSLEQLHTLELDPGPNSSKKLFAATIDEAVDEAIRLRRELRAKPIVDIRDVEIAVDLDRRAREALDLPILVGDAIIGDALAEGGEGGDTTSLSLTVGEAMKGDPTYIGRLRNQAGEGLSTDLPAGRPSRRPFHWVVEFPEVFSAEKRGFDALVGNPPFLGGKRIVGAMGSSYLNFLITSLGKKTRGSSDLVAFFFLASFLVCRNLGCIGLIATKSIAEGGTKKVGLENIISLGGEIYSAVRSETWPGSANVVTSRIQICKGKWSGKKTLNGSEVAVITAGLDEHERWKPVKLSTNSGLIQQGTAPLGKGFFLSETDAQAFIRNKPKYSQVIFPYLSGQDINRVPNLSGSRWIINFWDWEKDQARSFAPELFEILKEKVRGERLNMKSMGGAADTFWRHLWYRSELYHELGYWASFNTHPEGYDPDSPKLEHAIVVATAATKYPSFSLVPNISIFSNTLCVVASESYSLFACLSSDIHAVWAYANGSRLHERLRYTHGDIFETFPFPNGILEGNHEELEDLGRTFFETRRDYMVAQDKGMTSFYNDFHDPSKTTPELEECRTLQAEINEAVIRAYGFEGVDLDYDFHEVAYLPEGKNLRLTMSEVAREDMLCRLTALNKERHEAEPDGSISKKHAAKKATSKARKPSPKKETERSTAAISDFFAEDGSANTEKLRDATPEPPTERLYNWLYDRNGTWVASRDAEAAVGLSKEEFEDAVQALIADDDLLVREDDDETLLRAKG